MEGQGEYRRRWSRLLGLCEMRMRGFEHPPSLTLSRSSSAPAMESCTLSGYLRRGRRDWRGRGRVCNERERKTRGEGMLGRVVVEFMVGWLVVRLMVAMVRDVGLGSACAFCGANGGLWAGWIGST